MVLVGLQITKIKNCFGFTVYHKSTRVFELSDNFYMHDKCCMHLYTKK